MANSNDRRLVDLRPDLPRHQSADATSVVVDPKLPTMAPMAKVKALGRKTGQVLMDTKARLQGDGKARMEKVPKSTTSAQPARRKAQQARPKIAAPATDGYVRLELRSEDGRLSILGLHEVAGPLAIPDAVIHGHVYEVLAGDRRVSLGSIPDVGGRRAFANADVSEPQRKHRFFPDAAFNFFVRIPKAELRPEMLAQMQIVLHRIDAAPDHVSEQPLAKHAGVENVEIARLQGIKIEELPQQLRPQLERILKQIEQNR
jgi:hypothetical protein